MTPVILQVDQKGSGAFNTSQVLALGQTIYDQQNQLYITGDGVSTYKVLVARGISARAGHPLAVVNDSNFTIQLTGTPATALLQDVTMTLAWSGTLPVTRGGTGLNTLGTAGQLLKVNAGATALEYFTPTYGTGTVTNVSGTANRVSVINNTTTPVVDIDAAYVGQTSLTTLGTITTGVWSATAITAAKGGTGIDTSASTGFPEVSAGTWSIKTATQLKQDLGATAVGNSYFTLGNPSAVTFPRMNADNSVTARTATELKTDLSLNNVENTALSTWAGSANITSIGTIANYNSIVTANNGVPISVGSPVHLTGQTTSIAATTFYTTTADGFFTATVQLAVTTTGGTSIGCQIKFTNQADNTVKTMPSNNNNGMNQCASTSLNNAICYTITAYCKTGTDIQYVANVTGAAGVQYSLDATVLKL